MKRVIAILSVAAAFVMLNGCSKCSQDRPAEPPPAMEAPPAAPADPATPPAGEGQPPAAPGDQAQPPATPPAGEAK